MLRVHIFPLSPLLGGKVVHTTQQRFESAGLIRSKFANKGTASFIFGYFLWNIDVYLCTRLTQFKHTIGLPWGFLFELHGWWHIFTSIGAYIGMALVEYLVTVEEGNIDRIEKGFAWPVRAMLRDLEGREGKGEGRKVR